MDGVLCLSSGVHKEAFDRVLSSMGLEPVDYGSISGMKTREAFAMIFETRHLRYTDETLKAAVRQKQDMVLEELKNDKYVARGCAETLRYLRASYTLALATSASRQRAYDFLDASRTRELFEVVVTAEDVTRAKPAPDIYLLTLQKLGLQPSECCVIEDAVNGIISASQAGIPSIAIPGTHPAPELLACGAVEVIRKLEDLRELL